MGMSAVPWQAGVESRVVFWVCAWCLSAYQLRYPVSHSCSCEQLISLNNLGNNCTSLSPRLFREIKDYMIIRGRRGRS